MPNGIIIIDKPSDWTSMDVCAKLRGILKEKKIVLVSRENGLVRYKPRVEYEEAIKRMKE